VRRKQGRLLDLYRHVLGCASLFAESVLANP
jgi:hypothetical protein